MKKRLLSALLCLCMVLTLLPAGAWAAVPSGVTVDGTWIFANGNAITLKAGTSADKTLIYLDSAPDTPVELTATGNTTDGYDLSNYMIYGGCNNSSSPAATVENASVTMEGGKVSKIFGGGRGTSTSYADPTSIVNGTATVTIKGGSVDLLYGGGDFGATTGSTSVTISGGTVGVCNAGHTSSGKVLNSMTLTMTGGTVDAMSIKSSDAPAYVASGATVHISGGTVRNGLTSRSGDKAVLTVSGSAAIGAEGSSGNGLKYSGFQSVTITDTPTVRFEPVSGAAAGDTVAAAAALTNLSLCGSQADKFELELNGGNVQLKEKAQIHTHNLSVDCETDSGTQVTFQALTSRDGALYIDGKAAEVSSTYKAYMLSAGNYYLAGDVRLDRQIRLTSHAQGADPANSTVNFCLNGYKLEYAGDHNYSPVIYVGTDAYALNICDCNPTGTDRTGNVIDDPVSGYTKVIWGGVITGGRYAGVTGGDAPVTLYGGTIAGNGWATGSIPIYGGGVNADNFVMHGGAILYNMATYGGGVDTGDSFTMTGGTISDNWAARMNGGVHTVTNVGSGTSTSVTLSGGAKITGNVMGALKTTPSNLNLVEGSVVTVAPEGLGEDFRVGISSVWNPPTANSPATVAQDSGAALTAGDLAKFSSDDSNYELKLSNGKIVLALPHVHSWAAAWTTNAAHHWHKCTAAGCSITDYTNCAETGAAYGAHVYDDDQDAECSTCGYTRTIMPPDSGGAEGKVEMVGDAPTVTVDEGSLKDLAGTPAADETITVKLTVEKRAESDAAGAADIKGAATGKTVEFLDLSLVKTVTGGANAGSSPITDTRDKVLEIMVNYDLSGKKDVTVYRYHDGAAETLTKNDTKADGTFQLGTNSITIYTTKFSTYAIGYTPAGGGGGGYVPPTYAVELPAFTPGGKLSASHKSASSGTTVTLTLAPDEGYEIGGVAVTDQNGKTVAVTSKGDGKYTFTMPSGKVSVNAEFTKSKGGYASCPKDDSCPIRRFTDADPAAWYHDGVHYCVENGLMSGYGGGLFGPDDNLSRAEFAQILYNREGGPAAGGGNGFTDVPSGAWYANAVTWGAVRGIVGGYGNGRFGPGDSITCEQLAVMLWRYAGSPAVTEKELHFTDAGKAGGWALEALCWAVDQGILRGKDGGLLDPKGMMTRAEAAQMLKNFMEKR